MIKPDTVEDNTGEPIELTIRRTCDGNVIALKSILSKREDMISFTTRTSYGTKEDRTSVKTYDGKDKSSSEEVVQLRMTISFEWSP